MSAWLLLRPPRTDETKPRYFVAIDGELVRTTSQALLAKRFHTADQARQFAITHEPHFDEWRLVRR